MSRFGIRKTSPFKTARKAPIIEIGGAIYMTYDNSGREQIIMASNYASARRELNKINDNLK